MSNLYQNPVTNHNTRIYGTNNYTFIAIRGIILYELFHQSPGFMQSVPQTMPVVIIQTFHFICHTFDVSTI